MRWGQAHFSVERKHKCDMLRQTCQYSAGKIANGLPEF